MPIFTRGAYSLSGSPGKDALPVSGQQYQLAVVEPVDEAPADTCEMGRAGLGELRAAGRRQPGIEPAPVPPAPRPLDRACPNEPVDEARQAALAEHDRSR